MIRTRQPQGRASRRAREAAGAEDGVVRDDDDPGRATTLDGRQVRRQPPQHRRRVRVTLVMRGRGRRPVDLRFGRIVTAEKEVLVLLVSLE